MSIFFDFIAIAFNLIGRLLVFIHVCRNDFLTFYLSLTNHLLLMLALKYRSKCDGCIQPINFRKQTQRYVIRLNVWVLVVTFRVMMENLDLEDNKDCMAKRVTKALEDFKAHQDREGFR